MLGGEVFESVDSDVHAESRDSQEMALRTAEKLLKELKPKVGQQQVSYQLLQGMLQLATKNKELPDLTSSKTSLIDDNFGQIITLTMPCCLN